MTDQQENPVTVFRQQLGKQMRALQSMLPEHVSVEKFCRTAQLAVTNNEDLLNANRETLFNALQQCAADGLYPDNREATIQIYNTNIGTRQSPRWVKKAQYMPMVQGVINKLSGSANIIAVNTVYDKDEMEYKTGDHPSITHTPYLGEERGAFLGAYCILGYANGERYIEFMHAADVLKARGKSKSPNGAWAEWFDELAKKTVIHRCSKRVPLSRSAAAFMREDMDTMLGQSPSVKPDTSFLDDDDGDKEPLALEDDSDEAEEITDEMVEKYKEEQKGLLS